jgi:predicted small secreted protein
MWMLLGAAGLWALGQLGGCNMMSGIGKDIAWLGNALSDTAQDVGS